VFNSTASFRKLREFSLVNENRYRLVTKNNSINCDLRFSLYQKKKWKEKESYLLLKVHGCVPSGAALG